LRLIARKGEKRHKERGRWGLEEDSVVLLRKKEEASPTTTLTKKAIRGETISMKLPFEGRRDLA